MSSVTQVTRARSGYLQFAGVPGALGSGQRHVQHRHSDRILSQRHKQHCLTISNCLITLAGMQVLDKPAKQATEIRQAGLVEAALTLAAQRSPASITTTDLATAVGITQGGIFRHFASKEAIWLAVMDWVTATLMARLNDAAHQNRLAPMQALRGVFVAHVDFVMAYPGVPRVIFQELQSPDDTALKAGVRRLMQQYRQLLIGLLTQAQADGALPRQLDLPAAAVLFIGSIQGLVMQSLISGHIAGMAQLAPGVFAIFQRGIQADSLS